MAMPWVSVDQLLRRAAEEETAELARITRYREAAKPPQDVRGMVKRRHKRKRPPPVAEVPTGGRTWRRR
jgi:hypothetical protein